jgi:hypothetical protein
MDRVFGLEIPRTLEEICRPDRMAPLVASLRFAGDTVLTSVDAICELMARHAAAPG